ncbi:uncharacterized protein BJX67DRAFT_361284 [Aspergillus lucknowensis]|uniref:F-box domain-containing protein n=1 Tax=Aspergillus lucknowensis TaxID=176173 RepID=A0ABR4LIX5_9EURO
MKESSSEPMSLDAVVSKQWQAIIERKPFSYLKVTATELAKFARTTPSWRQLLIRTLQLVKIDSP